MPRMDKLEALKAVEKARLNVHSQPVELVAGRDAPQTLQVSTSVGLTAAIPEMLNRFNDITGIEQVTEQAVRAAAVRAAGEHPHVDLADRLRELAANDPCDVVRWNARYYLQQLK